MSCRKRLVGFPHNFLTHIDHKRKTLVHVSLKLRRNGSAHRTAADNSRHDFTVKLLSSFDVTQTSVGLLMHRQNNLMFLTRQPSADKSYTTCATGANVPSRG